MFDVPRAPAWTWIEPLAPVLEATFGLTDRLRLWGQLSTAPVPPDDPLGDVDIAFRPATDGGVTFDLCEGWGLTGGYTGFSTELTFSSSRDDRIRAMFEGGAYFVGIEYRY